MRALPDLSPFRRICVRCCADSQLSATKLPGNLSRLREMARRAQKQTKPAAGSALTVRWKTGWPSFGPLSLFSISSPHAKIAMPGAMAYNMVKAANDQMASTAAVELAQHRIRVNLIHPGWIDTPCERKFFTEETLQERAAKLSWGRLGK